jgi:hypothetical protein
MQREGKKDMKPSFCLKAVLSLVLFTWLFPFPPALSALEEGVVTGKVQKSDSRFARDYDAMDYKGQLNWQEWGKGLKSIGWVVVQGASGQLKDYLLLVVDTRTKILSKEGAPGAFEDLVSGAKVTVEYRMGWDALHALNVRILE